jgi:hypothetical protein
MARPLRFEPFDASPVTPVPQGPSDDWLAGHARGLSDATEAAAVRRAVAEEAALAALGDLSFTWAEARATVLASLVPFFRSLSDRLLPEIAAGAFPLHLVDELSRAAARDIATAPHLRLSPADMVLVAQLDLGGVRLTADPTLSPGQARLGHGAGSTLLDTPALLAALQEVTAAFLAAADPQTEGHRAHG